ncbi:MAG TPA: response regulator [Bacteroidia bacterium]|jgi:DNA-binding NtrC family response regulator|nr:response regulator [Bacteroidia bacterium]
METREKLKKKVFVKPQKRIISIFLVDDDLSYLYPLGFYLQKNTEHAVYCYKSGEECMENIHKAPDVIILDYNLNPEQPDAMNGLDVLKEIKREMPKTKVVMLSGRETFSGVTDSLKLGAYTYVIKDIEALTTLKKIIESVAEEKPKEEL